MPKLEPLSIDWDILPDILSISSLTTSRLFIRPSELYSRIRLSVRLITSLTFILRISFIKTPPSRARTGTRNI